MLPCLVTMFPWALPRHDSFSDFFFFFLTVLRITDYVFCSMSLDLSLSHILYGEAGVMDFEEKDPRS